MAARKNRLSRGIALSALLVFSYATAAASANLPAFPGAEGFGACTPGGRGGRVIEVVNLNPSGPGSLDAACRAKGPRIVVFRVSGLINRAPSVTEPFITIAGQTAPGDGICLRNTPFYVATHDVVIRYLRSRVGDHPLGRNAEARESIHITGKGVRNVIVDHCSFSWSPDVNATTWGAHRDVTIQWCLITEGLRDSIHQKGARAKGMLLGCDSNTISVHHCLFAHNLDRNPYINQRRSKTASILDLRNNVVYSSERKLHAHGGGNALFNYVGNLILRGPNGVGRGPAFWLVKYGHSPKVYAADNIWPGMTSGADARWRAVRPIERPRPPELPVSARLAGPAPAPRVTTLPASQLLEVVLNNAGCTRPVRDVVDDRVIAEVRARGGRTIDSQRDVGGWPTYASAKPPADTDRDGMTDVWEKRHGFNPKDPADGPKDLDGDGYTNVEEFLNLTNPAKPDTGAAAPQRPVVVQSGNDRMRRGAARKIGEELLAKAKTVNATPESRNALLKKVRESGKEVADLLGMKFVNIPPGEFELWKVKIKVTKPFEIGACEVTQAQWEAVMGKRPWAGQPAVKDDPEFPATYISYLDVQEFIARLNACLPVRGAQTGGGRKYRLPTQAEWRVAAQGGTRFVYGFKEDRARAHEYAWCCYRVYKNKRMVEKHFPTLPQAVGKLKPNAFGVYDMAGNVREMVSDYSSFLYYRDHKRYGAERTDPTGPKTGKNRTVCGGNFRYVSSQILRRRPYTGHSPHYSGFGLGFRLVRTAP